MVEEALLEHCLMPSYQLVPRTRSSRTSCGKFDRELRVQRGTRIIELLVVPRFRGSHRSAPQALANLGIGPLVWPGCGTGGDRGSPAQRESKAQPCKSEPSISAS